MDKMTLKAFWHPVATADEVATQPKQVRLLGERIVTYRDDKGVIAFKDLCIHRGAELSLGKVEGSEIVCPYHGWRYNRMGVCTAIPSLPPGAAIPAKARVIAYGAQEAYGLIWVKMVPSDLPLPAWPDNAWDRPGYRTFLAGTYSWKASAARIVENVLDFSHFNFVHKGLTEIADGPVIKPYDVTRTNHRLEFAYEDGRLRREYVLEFPYTTHDRKFVINVGNGATWSENGDSRKGDVTIVSFVASPLSDNETRIFAFVGRNHSLDKPNSDFTGGLDAVMEQDRVIVEAQHPEQVPVDLSEELHLRYPDAAAVAYRRMLRELDHLAAV
jgi:phenylpropionate dioxygenase-like ring-hydroxylating dioxygenase large terminal subunit